MYLNLKFENLINNIKLYKIDLSIYDCINSSNKDLWSIRSYCINTCKWNIYLIVGESWCWYWINADIVTRSFEWQIDIHSIYTFN